LHSTHQPSIQHSIFDRCALGGRGVQVPMGDFELGELDGFLRVEEGELDLLAG
jgi:hypothetical protein